MVQAKPLQELARNAPSRRAQQRALQAEQEQLKHCTFQPDLSKPAVHEGKPIVPSAALTLHGQVSMQFTDPHSGTLLGSPFCAGTSPWESFFCKGLT